MMRRAKGRRRRGCQKRKVSGGRAAKSLQRSRALQTLWEIKGGVHSKAKEKKKSRLRGTSQYSGGPTNKCGDQKKKKDEKLLSQQEEKK